MNEKDDTVMPDLYDRMISALSGLPDVVHSRPTTIRTLTPLLGNSQTYIVQTYRQKERGDTIFLESMGREGSLRIVLPPQVAEVISRQRDVLTTKNRRRAAKHVAQERMDRGEMPAFLKKKAG